MDNTMSTNHFTRIGDERARALALDNNSKCDNERSYQINVSRMCIPGGPDNGHRYVNQYIHQDLI